MDTIVLVLNKRENTTFFILNININNTFHQFNWFVYFRNDTALTSKEDTKFELTRAHKYIQTTQLLFL